jgi:hypothetical protein
MVVISIAKAPVAAIASAGREVFFEMAMAHSPVRGADILHLMYG